MNRQQALQILRHIVALIFVGFFILSFFVGSSVDPEFVEIARSPYGLFAYFIITISAVFIPSFTTIPAVLTATLIWGPWIAGGIALVGWTIAGVLEYSAGYFAKNSLTLFLNGGNKLEEKMERLKGSLGFWHMLAARAVVPSFIFGMMRVRPSYYALLTVLVFIPWAIAGAVGGGGLLPYF